MANDIRLLVYPVKDIAKAKNFFRKFLGTDPYVESDFYVGFKIGEHEIGLDPNSDSQGPIGYIDVQDIKTTLQELLEDGAELVLDVKDVGQGLLVAQVRDDNGNILGLRQAP